MPRISISISGPAKGRFGQAYLEALGEILEAHFTKVTGLALNAKWWFLFNAREELQSPEPEVFTIPGHIIGPDSVGYDAEITSDGCRVHVHIAFGTSASIPEHIIRLMQFLRELHAEHPVGKVTVGALAEPGGLTTCPGDRFRRSLRLG